MAKKNITKKTSKTTKKVVKAQSNNIPLISKKVSKKTKVSKKIISNNNSNKDKNNKLYAKSKNRVTRIFSITIAFILLIIAAYLLITNDLTNENKSVSEKLIFNESMLNVIVVEDLDCATCLVDAVLDQMKTNIFNDLNPIRVAHNSKLGKEILSEVGSKFAPSYIFEEKIINDSKWANLETAYKKVSYNNETYYMISHNLIPSKVLVNEVPKLEGAITIGNPNAKVTVYEFSDYQCQFCAIANGNEDLVAQFQKSNPSYVPIIPNLFKDYVDSGLVKFVYYNFPLENSNVRARGAGIASLCANEQGMWKEFNDKLYNERDSWMKAANVEEEYIKFAQELEMDVDSFGICLSSESALKYSEQIDREKELANEIDVSATPTFIIDRNFIVGAIDYNEVKFIIDSKLNSELANNE